MLVRGEVIERDNHNGARSGEDFVRTDAFVDIACHPAHLAVMASRKPLFQPAPFVFKRIGANNSDLVESLEKSPLLDVLCEGHCAGSF
jgi:hypothetical protein